MAYKPLDLQVSMPRTLELSPLQQQQQQRPAMEQAMLGQQAVKQAEKQARSNTKAEGAAKRSISDKEPKERKKMSSIRNKPNAEEREGADPASAHPYKGKHLDISL
ncbi:hypothetical protein [Cohnella thailandensis]|uniref:RNA polymerase subunit sigma n=1 Tax=Cohnella thailandensis TaxID=557557 RepID=A0A841T0Y2_9BACL|nr:hypothetical protein [Cohnella thailandensis]MBB6636729.1 hypothetical protein [Cohnella thailandensis]MBP1973395.1 hypothetical protein [Cohnella thailandensis]